jgi:tetratricopeptide (TPR) repeat protein
MSGLKDFLPAPVVDIFLPIVLVLIAGRILLPILKRKLEDSGAWDQILDKLGGEKLRRIQFQREIASLKKSGDVVGAAQLYEEAEWYPEALELYLEAGDYIGAGILYEKLNHSEQAAEMYLKADDWKRAAATYAEAGHQGKAAELFEQHGQKIDAAKRYFEAGQYGRAAELYEEVSHFPQAAQAFEKMGEFVRAADNYEKHWAATSSFGGGGLIASPTERDAKVARMAGQLYEKGGAPDKAAALYRRARLSKQAAALAAREGRYDEAGEMLLKDEELEKAAEMFEKAGQRERAAGIRGEVAFRKGENALAAQEFLKGGDALRAAELFESVGDLASAAKCFEQSESLIQAANVYLRADKKDEAARLFEQGGDAKMAAKLYSEIGEDAKASELFEKAERFYEAGMLAHKRQDSERAIQLLQRIDPSDERYEAATLLVSRLFIDKNMTSLAKEKLLRALGDRPIGPQTLEHFYCLGLVYEKLGKRTEAIETFRKIMAERYGYEDVEKRIARLSAVAEPEPVPQEAEAPRAPEKPAPPPAPPGQPATSTPRIKITGELGRGFAGRNVQSDRHPPRYSGGSQDPQEGAAPEPGDRAAVSRRSQTGAELRAPEPDSLARSDRADVTESGRHGVRGGEQPGFDPGQEQAADRQTGSRHPQQPLCGAQLRAPKEAIA